MTQEIRTIRIATQGPAGPPGGPASVFSVASQAAMLALAAHQGDMAVRSDISASFVLATNDPTQLVNWTALASPSGGAVSSVAGRTGDVVLAAADISGLGALATLGAGSGLSSGGGNLSANVTSVAGRSGAVAIAQADVSGLTTSDVAAFRGLTVSGAANASLVSATGYSLTGSDAHAMVSYAGTLNTTGAPDIVAVHITDTAHGGNAMLLNLYAGSDGNQSKFKVAFDGSTVAAKGVQATNFNTSSDTTGYFQFGSKAYLNGSATDGVMTLLDNGGTGNVRFNFGGTTSSFPALKRNGSAFDVRLGDDSGYATLNAANVSASGTVVATSYVQANGVISSSYVQASDTGSIAWSTRAKLFSPGDGQVSLNNNAATQSHTLTVGANALLSHGGPVGLKNYTVATLPSGVQGMMAYVTDGDAALAWGTTAVNSGAGATSYVVWFNGSNWTVIGK